MQIPVKPKRAEYVGTVMRLVDDYRKARREEDAIVDWKIGHMTTREFTRLEGLYGNGYKGEERAAKILRGLYKMSREPRVVESYRRWRDKRC